MVPPHGINSHVMPFILEQMLRSVGCTAFIDGSLLCANQKYEVLDLQREDSHLMCTSWLLYSKTNSKNLDIRDRVTIIHNSLDGTQLSTQLLELLGRALHPALMIRTAVLGLAVKLPVEHIETEAM